MKFSGKFLCLLLAAAAVAVGLYSCHLPAAWFFGPLLVSVISAVSGWQAVELPRPMYIAAQATIGAAMGAGFAPSTLRILPQHPYVFCLAVLLILGTSLVNGWLLARNTQLDTTTAFLGTMPGGAGEMAAMSDNLGADTRLVTVMQYTRLLLIIISLMVVVPILRHVVHTVPGVLAPAPATPELVFSWQGIGILCLITAAGTWVGLHTRIPAGTFLIPTLLYLGVQMLGIRPGHWPLPILAMAYVTMGLQIGGRFRPSTLVVIREILLPVCGTTLLLLSISVGLALILVKEMGLDFVSAYLAATPGGMDSVAAMATEIHGDTAIILAVHILRLLCVLLLGPWLVRFCSKCLAGSVEVQDKA